MNPTDPVLSAYAELDAKIKALEAQREGLRTEIVKRLENEEDGKIESPLGTFTVARKVTWKYSDTLVKAEEQLKIKKIHEQKKGVAVASEKPYLLYRSSKE